jgi:hypothetical protein
VLSRLKVNETDAAAFWAVLNHKKAGNAANHFLRRLQNFAWGMRWLFEPVIPNPLWPKVKKKKTTAISIEEHARITSSPSTQIGTQSLFRAGHDQSTPDTKIKENSALEVPGIKELKFEDSELVTTCPENEESCHARTRSYQNESEQEALAKVDSQLDSQALQAAILAIIASSDGEFFKILPDLDPQGF